MYVIPYNLYQRKTMTSEFDNTDHAIARDFYSLSFQDRNDINEEVHGVQSMAQEETPELIEESLRMLSIELRNLPLCHKHIYEQALNMRRMHMNGKSNGNGEDNFSSSSINDDEYDNDGCYVETRDFQLMFLRCELFNPKKAAIRLVTYLELAYETYGEVALRRPLRIDDLQSTEEIDVLKSGHHQLLPFRDRSGRRVLALHRDLSLPSASVLSQSVLSSGPGMKLMLYLWTVLAEDIESQRKGLVVVIWPRYTNTNNTSNSTTTTSSSNSSISDSHSYGIKNNNDTSKRIKRKLKFNNYNNKNINAPVPNADARSMGKRFFQAIPVRVCSLHVCFPDTPFFHMIRHILILIVGESLRTRVKLHSGDGTEVHYKLLGYGIPVETLPMDEITGNIKTKNQSQFIAVRKRIEGVEENNSGHVSSGSRSSSNNNSNTNNNTPSMIECPLLNDVIFRSGKSYLSHPGNANFRGLIEQYISAHTEASQDKKIKITWEVIEEVESKSGRFLEYDKGLGTWTELTNRSAVRHKIATYFKEYRRKLKAHGKTQISQSSTHKFEQQYGKKRKRVLVQVGGILSKNLPQGCFSSCEM